MREAAIRHRFEWDRLCNLSNIIPWAIVDETARKTRFNAEREQRTQI